MDSKQFNRVPSNGEAGHLPRNTLREERDRLKNEVLKLCEDNRKLRKEIIELRVELEAKIGKKAKK